MSRPTRSPHPTTTTIPLRSNIDAANSSHSKSTSPTSSSIHSWSTFRLGTTSSSSQPRRKPSTASLEDPSYQPSRHEDTTFAPTIQHHRRSCRKAAIHSAANLKPTTVLPRIRALDLAEREDTSNPIVWTMVEIWAASFNQE